jgi:hypothetical protein
VAPDSRQMLRQILHGLVCCAAELCVSGNSWTVGLVTAAQGCLASTVATLQLARCFSCSWCSSRCLHANTPLVLGFACRPAPCCCKTCYTNSVIIVLVLDICLKGDSGSIVCSTDAFAAHDILYARAPIQHPQLLYCIRAAEH